MKYLFGAALLSCLALAGCSKENPAEPTSKSENATQPALKNAASKQETPPVEAVKKGPWNGPFGVQMGLSVADLEASGLKLTKVQPGVYSSKTAPSPHQAFEEYNFLISSTSGLCKVNAVGKDIATNSFGESVRSTFSDLKTALTEKYGKPSADYDFLRKGSIWRDSRDWMMALKLKDRTLATFWEFKSENSAGLDSLMLNASATDSTEGFITLRYGFKNESECIDEIRKAENSSL